LNIKQRMEPNGLREDALRAAPAAPLRASPNVVRLSPLLQACLNSELGASLGSGIFAAVVCYLIGFPVLSLVAALQTCAKRHAASQPQAAAASAPKLTATAALPPMRWWQYGAGVLGCTGLFITVVCTPVLGVTLYFGVVVLGVLLAAAVLDHVGFVGMERTPFTHGRMLPLLIALVGVMIVAFSDVEVRPQPGAPSAGAVAGFALLAVLGGALGPMQALLNWRVSKQLHSKPRALMVSYGVALCIAVIGSGAVLLSRGASAADLWRQLVLVVRGGQGEGTQGARPYIICGAFGGLVTLAAGAHFPRKLSAATYFTLLLCGELAGSLLFDNFGLVGLPQRPAKPMRIAGVLLVLTGAVLMRFSMVIDEQLVVAYERLHVAEFVARRRAFFLSGTARTARPSLVPTSFAHGDGAASMLSPPPLLATLPGSIDESSLEYELAHVKEYTALRSPAAAAATAAAATSGAGTSAGAAASTSRISRLSRLSFESSAGVHGRRSRFTSLDALGNGLLGIDSPRGEVQTLGFLHAHDPPGNF
jgi:transporter family-2 protein